MFLLDNTVLSNFAKISELSVLAKFCNGRGATTELVIQEFQKGIENNRFPSSTLEWLQVLPFQSKEENLLFDNLKTHLGKGEASCIAIAYYRKLSIYTDDQKARKMIRQINLHVSGSIGILIQCCKKKQFSIEEGNHFLQKFIKTGYYSPIKDLKELL